MQERDETAEREREREEREREKERESERVRERESERERVRESQRVGERERERERRESARARARERASERDRESARERERARDSLARRRQARTCAPGSKHAHARLYDKATTPVHDLAHRRPSPELARSTSLQTCSSMAQRQVNRAPSPASLEFEGDIHSVMIKGFPLLFKDMLILQYHSCFRDIYIKALTARTNFCTSILVQAVQKLLLFNL
jgi:hypothetical protein